MAGRMPVAARDRQRGGVSAIAILCGHCGSADVSCDAWAMWDEARQEWVLRTVFDYAYCHA